LNVADNSTVPSGYGNERGNLDENAETLPLKVNSIGGGSRLAGDEATSNPSSATLRGSVGVRNLRKVLWL
jgi:hypothetical protein